MIASDHKQKIKNLNYATVKTFQRRTNRSPVKEEKLEDKGQMGDACNTNGGQPACYSDSKSCVVLAKTSFFLPREKVLVLQLRNLSPISTDPLP